MPDLDLDHTMPIGDVGRALGLSANGVRRHDETLAPVRLVNGARRYNPARVRAFIAARTSRKAA
jgi:hypothetical protein